MNFDELGNKIANFGSNAAKGAAKGAKKFGSSVKQGTATFTENIALNSKIDTAKKDLKETYADLGQKFCEANQEADPAGFEEQFERIRQIKKYIEDTQQELRNLTGVRTCPQCGADVAKGYQFCTGCGFKMPEEQPQQPAGNICTGCGRVVPEGSMFCNFCGTKIVPKQAAPEQPQEQPPVCPSCGNSIAPGTLFCTNCGTKVAQ